MASLLERARASFVRQAWREACDALAAAAGERPLAAEDNERFAVAAYLIGADDTCEKAWEAAHRAAVDAGDQAGAARFAVLLALCLVLRGQMAQAGGWLMRAEGHVAESGVESAASGYVLVPKVLGALESGEPQAAHDMAVSASELGQRFDDPDLRALGVLGQGQALLVAGDTAAGLARFDEVMLSVTSDEVGPIVAGIVYCAVVIECFRMFDLARASEWTRALSDWCDAQPDLVPYRGQCLVHRSQLHQASGHWTDAISAADAACRRLADPPHPALGFAYYQLAELHRLSGDLDRGEALYREASRNGQHPMPGLALLDLARGDAAAAASSIGRALQETALAIERPPLLAAAVESYLSVADVSGARDAADELASLASASPSPLLGAMAAHAMGSVLVAEGDPVPALGQLRAAATAFRTLGMPYEEARTAVLVGLACAALGDATAAALEFDNARAAFTDLGAKPDLDRLQRLTGPREDADAADRDRLSKREHEVLLELAAGKTNREIAAALTVSQHTVARHVENIFAKLGVSNRAAATAYAYEHDLVRRPDR